jgi:hypothetical protein
MFKAVAGVHAPASDRCTTCRAAEAEALSAAKALSKPEAKLPLRVPPIMPLM